MTNKTFTHAGVSRLNGVIKARFANDALRVKVLAKGGHTEIDLVEFLEPLGKIEAVMKLIEMDFAKGNTEYQAALEAELDKRTEAPKAEKAPKAPKAAKAPAKTKAKPITIEAIKARAPAKTKSKAEITAELADLDDAPF
jgi:hypothetical protein